MKLLPRFLWGLAAMAILLPGLALSQSQNELGIYTEEMSSNITAAPYSQHVLYLIITNPYNYELDRPVEAITGYECQISIDGPVMVTEVTWPEGFLNIGNTLKHIVAFQEVPVVGNAAQVCTLHTIFLGTEGQLCTMSLNPVVPGSIDGAMAYLDENGNYVLSLYPVSGDWESPVFAFNADPQIVATEATSFANLKAMYR